MRRHRLVIDPAKPEQCEKSTPPTHEIIREIHRQIICDTTLGVDVTRIGLEAGPLSQWLHDGLAEAGLPVVCAETRQLKAVLSATVNKSDRNDAHGIAQMVRVNLIRPVHVKTVSSQEKRLLLTNRKWNGRLPPLMSEVERVGIDAHGPTASRCQGGSHGVFPGKPEGPG